MSIRNNKKENNQPYPNSEEYKNRFTQTGTNQTQTNNQPYLMKYLIIFFVFQNFCFGSFPRNGATILQLGPVATYSRWFIRVQTIEYALVQFIAESSLQTSCLYEGHYSSTARIGRLYVTWGHYIWKRCGPQHHTRSSFISLLIENLRDGLHRSQFNIYQNLLRQTLRSTIQSCWCSCLPFPKVVITIHLSHCFHLHHGKPFFLLRFEIDRREMPVLWHQAFLTFVQRYKNDISSEQKEALLNLLK